MARTAQTANFPVWSGFIQPGAVTGADSDGGEASSLICYTVSSQWVKPERGSVVKQHRRACYHGGADPSRFASIHAVLMIDAHFHIWQLSRADYGWLTPAQGVIFRDVALDDWRAVSSPCGVIGGVLVQAAPTEAETHFLLRQADAADDVLGVVGWTDLSAIDAPARIQALARNPKLKALRPMLQDIADPDWVLQPALDAAFDAMLACDLAFDALVKPRHLARIVRLARRYPSLRIVVDHGAKPDIAQGQWQDWADGMSQLAQCENVCCKLSGLWTEAGPGADATLTQRYGQHILDRFGARRVMWGSDWPVLERAGTYARWHGLARALVPETEHAAVFDAVARQQYRL